MKIRGRLCNIAAEASFSSQLQPFAIIIYSCSTDNVIRLIFGEFYRRPMCEMKQHTKISNKHKINSKENVPMTVGCLHQGSFEETQRVHHHYHDVQYYAEFHSLPHLHVSRFAKSHLYHALHIRRSICL